MPLDVVVIGPSTTLRLNNGIAVRSWRFFPDHKLKLCTVTVHGDRHDRCDIYALPQ